MSQSKLSKIENAKVRPLPRDVLRLANVMGLTSSVRASLVKAAFELEEIHAPRPHQQWQSQEEFHSLVADSRAYRSSTSKWIPLFAQTPSYIAWISQFDPRLISEREYVSTRMRVQAQLIEMKTEQTALVDLEVLTRPRLPARLWLEQLYALIPRARLAGVDLGIVLPEDNDCDVGLERCILDDNFAIQDSPGEFEERWDRPYIRDALRNFDSRMRTAIWDGEAEAVVNNVIRRFEREVNAEVPLRSEAD